MQGDLISRSALLEEIKKQDTSNLTKGLVLQFIEKQPTAYDVEEVVAELEEARKKYQRLCMECDGKEDEAMDIHYRNIIRIVRNGGKE